MDRINNYHESEANSLRVEATVPDTGERYPGVPLSKGTRGGAVLRMQSYLNVIHQKHPRIKLLTEDGIFGANTQLAVEMYQQLFALPVTGIIDERTWNSIVATYHTIPGSEHPYPGHVLRHGSTGTNVAFMQQQLNILAKEYTAIPHLSTDGHFGSATEKAVRLFQRQFGLSADGDIGANTWNSIVARVAALQAGTPTKVVTKYPGSTIRRGSTSDWTRCAQSYLSSIPSAQGGSPSLKVDGNFGTGTKTAVEKFQKAHHLKVDGIIGSGTWNILVPAFNNHLAS
ncbi:peptidoglycan-binding protein [Ruminococcaceae bacterium OttesenSCG-928-N02]|nr:peptidoglycan-binding protein [Ruminococcaceae bacterium OttesenSCG-928-N02]